MNPKVCEDHGFRLAFWSKVLNIEPVSITRDEGVEGICQNEILKPSMKLKN